MSQRAVWGGLAVALMLAGAATAKPARFVQDRFAIGFWVDPPADAQMDERYAQIAKANFTLVLGGFGARKPDQIRRQLDLCRKYGLKALAWAGKIPADQLLDGPACWGYLVRDEPASSDFAALHKRVDAIRAARPGHLAFINLFPNVANLKRQLQAPSYDNYVSRYVNEVEPDVLCMDHYPNFRPGRDERPSYCKNLEIMRKYSLEKHIPFWNFFNTMPYGNHTDPTVAQLRWQIFTSLAYGAKGVLYFCYWTPGGQEFLKGGAIIRRDGTPTRHYHQAQRINAVLKNLGPTLMKLISTGVRRIAPSTDIAKALKGSPIKALGRAPSDPPLNLLVGTFKSKDGRRAVLLTNYSITYTSWPTVTFDAPQDKVVEVDPHTGKEVPVYDESPAMRGLQVSLAPGEGRLFLLP